MTHHKLKFVQPPNAPLIIAGLGGLIGLFTTDVLHLVGQTVFIVALAIWAYLEVTKGANWFRKLLGALTFLFIVWMLFNQLG